MPAEVMLLEPNDSVSSYSQHILELKENLQRSHESARQHLKRTSKRMKEEYDAKITHHNFEVGDLVLFASTRGQLHLAPKLRHTFEGPFVVT